MVDLPRFKAQARAAASALEQQLGYVLVRRLAALSMIVPSERLPKVV